MEKRVTEEPSTEEPTTTEPTTEKPTIITKPCNITTEVGLPVTLKCSVEGDPSHYLLGWMSRNAIIKKGEEHSVSTSPSFQSANGTVHYLTIHTVKTSGKYHCNVYTMSKKVVDQVTHQVIVDNGMIYHNRCTTLVLNFLLLQEMILTHLSSAR